MRYTSSISSVVAGLLAVALVAFISCKGDARATVDTPQEAGKSADDIRDSLNYDGKIIHVLVALCDNDYQGIVPVPARIGNGDDPANNLYWGAAYGVKTYFSKGGEWLVVARQKNPSPVILERIVFRHNKADAYLIADAYRGREIRECTIDLLQFAAGQEAHAINIGGNGRHTSIPAGGAADLVAYVGHDGLMDFSLDDIPRRNDNRRRDAIVLACISKRYFLDPLHETGASPLLLTTGLMAPEAYVLKAALDGWTLGESGENIRSRAAVAYNRYQKCGLKAARRLFATGK